MVSGGSRQVAALGSQVPQIGRGDANAPPLAGRPEAGQGLLKEGGRPVKLAALAPDHRQVVAAAGQALRMVGRLVVGDRRLEPAGGAVEIAPIDGDPAEEVQRVGDLASAPGGPRPAQRLLRKRGGPIEGALRMSQYRRAVQRSGADGGFHRQVPGRGQQPLVPGATLAEVAAHPPEPDQRPGQPQRCLGLPPLREGGQGGTQVAVIGFEPVQPAPLLRPGQERRGRFGHGQEMARVRRPHPLRFAIGDEPPEPELADRLQHGEARLRIAGRVAPNQAVVDQGADDVEDGDVRRAS